MYGGCKRCVKCSFVVAENDTKTAKGQLKYESQHRRNCWRTGGATEAADTSGRPLTPRLGFT